MLITVDDSGDPGLKPGAGSSKHFVIAAVCFENEADAERMRRRINKLKDELGWVRMREFKFRKDRPETKRVFFSAIRNLNFRVSIVILEKSKIADRDFRKNPSKLYNATILKAVKSLSCELDDLYVHIDGEAGKGYRHRVKTYFRQSLPRGVLSDVDYRDSKDDVLVQLADMVVGVARHSVSDKPDAGAYLNLIKKHIDSISTYI